MNWDYAGFGLDGLGVAEWGLDGLGLVEWGLVEWGLVEWGLVEWGLVEWGLAELILSGYKPYRIDGGNDRSRNQYGNFHMEIFFL